MRTDMIVGGLVVAFAGGIGVGLAMSQTPPKVTRLVETDLSGLEGKELVVVEVDAPPRSVTPLHTHPGDEIVYQIEGTVTGVADGKTQERHPGEVSIYRRGVVSGATVGDQPSKLIAVFVVDKGKPLTVPAYK
jgi:quercetin dioxygenase-like cupin family protein